MKAYQDFLTSHFVKSCALFRGLQRDASDLRKVKHYTNRIFKMASKGRAMADCPANIREAGRTNPTAQKRCCRAFRRTLRRTGAK